MKFTVKTINSSRYEFDVDDDETVENLKNMLQEKTNIDPARQKLIFLGKVLQNNKLLSEYNVDGKVLHLVESQNFGPSPAGDSSSDANTSAATAGADADGAMREQIMNSLGDDATQIVDQIMSSLGVNQAQARVTRQTLDNGGVAVNLSVAGNSNEQFDIQIINGTVPAGIPNTASTSTASQATTSATSSSTTSATTTTTTSSSGATGASGATAPNTASRQAQGTPANLDRIINHLRSVRDVMQHINCTGAEAQDVINNTLITPCIRGQHTAGPTAEEGAAPEEVQQRATSRESVETYSHILIDLADIMQEMVRYMNQYARLLHRDPPLEGPNLLHAQNLVDRMGSMFHEVSHAFHMLSDYSITLDSALPRRLWMAQLTGAHVVLSRPEDVTQQLQQGLSRLRGRMRQSGTANGSRRPATGAATTSSNGTSSAPGPATVPATGPARSTATTNPTNTATRTNTTNPPNINPNQPFAISFDLPLNLPNLGNLGSPHAQIQHILTNRPAGGSRTGNAPPPRPSLSCNSRHRAGIFTPLRCPVHAPRPSGPARGHGHSHSHSHSHSHGTSRARAHGTRQPRSNGASQPSSRGPVTTPPAAQAAMDATNNMMENRMSQQAPTSRLPRPSAPGAPPDPFLASLMSNFASDILGNPEQISRYIQLATRMMDSSAQSQPMATFWPEIRTLMIPNITVPDQTHLGDLLHIIASNYTFHDFRNAVNNHLLFDILYRPMRDRFTQSVFNNQIPNQAQINNAVTEMIATDRNLIIAFFDVQQNEDCDVDENSTIVAMVREFVHAIFRELYNPARGDIAAGFGETVGRSLLRLVGLIVTYCRHVNPDDPRNRITNQMSEFLRTIIPYQNISREELYDSYIVSRHLEDTEDEEFVDAQEGGDNEAKDMEAEGANEDHKKDMTNEQKENEEKKPNDVEDSRPSPSMVTEDALPDDMIVNSSPVIVNGHGTNDSSVEIPSEWKRVIEDDTNRMGDATYQPLSDGYLSSLPAKRRKTETKRSEKPDDVLKDLLSNSVQKSENDEADLSHDPELAEMFKSKLKEDLKKKVQDNDDVDEEQFPSASKLKNDT